MEWGLSLVKCLWNWGQAPRELGDRPWWEFWWELGDRPWWELGTGPKIAGWRLDFMANFR